MSYDLGSQESLCCICHLLAWGSSQGRKEGVCQSQIVELGTWGPGAITACDLFSNIQSDSSGTLLLGHLFILEANFTCSEERKRSYLLKDLPLGLIGNKLRHSEPTFDLLYL